MDIGNALQTARQCLFFIASKFENVILYGSMAADRYIPPSMRFGEAGYHQDIDLILVSQEPELLPGELDDFATSVLLCVNETFAVLENAVTWKLSMTAAGLYCAKLYIQQHHFCDVVLVSESKNDLYEKRFPRQTCELVLPLFTDHRANVGVISFEEVMHRMASIISSVPTVDNTVIVPSRYNKIAITKNLLRLERLELLLALKLVSASPSAITFDMLPFLKTRKVQVVNSAVMPTFSTPKICSCKSQFVKEAEALTLSMSLVFDTFENKISSRMSALTGKIGNMEHSLKKFVDGVNARFNSDSRKTKAMLLRASDTLKEFRTSSFLAASKPIKALKEVIRMTECISKIVRVENCENTEDPSLGDYLEAYIVITEKMAKLQQLPFSMFPDVKAVHTTLSPEMNTREKCALSGMKMNLMASYTVFLQMLRLSNMDKADLPMKVVDMEAYADWSSPDCKRALIDMGKRVEKLSSFDIPKSMVVPLVSAIDGRVEFLMLKRPTLDTEDQELLRVMTETTNQHLFPAIDRYNMEFMMHMLDNVLGSITCPLLGHVGQLKSAMSAIYEFSSQIISASNIYIDDFMKTPFVAQVQVLRVTQDELFSAAESIQDDKPAFVWCTSSVKKRHRKKKK